MSVCLVVELEALRGELEVANGGCRVPHRGAPALEGGVEEAPDGGGVLRIVDAGVRGENYLPVAKTCAEGRQRGRHKVRVLEPEGNGLSGLVNLHGVDLSSLKEVELRGAWDRNNLRCGKEAGKESNRVVVGPDSGRRGRGQRGDAEGGRPEHRRHGLHREARVIHHHVEEDVLLGHPYRSGASRVAAFPRKLCVELEGVADPIRFTSRGASCHESRLHFNVIVEPLLKRDGDTSELRTHVVIQLHMDRFGGHEARGERTGGTPEQWNTPRCPRGRR
mmetsp:Transcript_9144/g.18719  ORF Transcript_9144/g.18719 Transcript_9144/m.18719 type:complete len:277 (-) Transcript_9144:119-949(-)